MSLQTFACPACGSRKTLADAQAGEKIHCTCGMSFPASPVFVVTDGGPKKAGGSGVFIALGGAVVIVGGAVALWKMTRHAAPSNDPTGTQVAITQIHADTRPEEGTEHPAAVPHGDSSGKAPALTASSKPAENPTPAVKPPPPPPLPAPVASVSAETLWDAYDLGPDVAARYTGKAVEVKAHGRILEDSFGRPYFGAVVVKPNGRPTSRMNEQQRQWEKEGYPPSVRCYLAADQTTKLEKDRDQEVVLRGICTGRKDRDDVYRGYIVELDNCIVVTPK